MVGSGSWKRGAHVDDSHATAGRVAHREPDQVGVKQLDSRARSVSFGSPCQVVQPWLQHNLGPLQHLDVVPHDLPPAIGMPESHMRGEPLDPVAHLSELAEQRAGAGHDRARHGRSVDDVYPDVVDPANVVAVEIDDAVVDQVAPDVH